MAAPHTTQQTDQGQPERHYAISGNVYGLAAGQASLAFVNDYANGRPAAGAISAYSINEPDGSAGVSGVVFMTRP